MGTPDCVSRVIALIKRETYRADKALGEAIATLHGDLSAKGTYFSSANVFLTRDQYEQDIDRRVAALLSIVRRVLENSSPRERREARTAIESLAETWLSNCIDGRQQELHSFLEHLRISGPVPDLSKDRTIQAMKAELAILFGQDSRAAT